MYCIYERAFFYLHNKNTQIIIHEFKQDILSLNPLRVFTIYSNYVNLDMIFYDTQL